MAEEPPFVLNTRIGHPDVYVPEHAGGRVTAPWRTASAPECHLHSARRLEHVAQSLHHRVGRLGGVEVHCGKLRRMADYSAAAAPAVGRRYEDGVFRQGYGEARPAGPFVDPVCNLYYRIRAACRKCRGQVLDCVRPRPARHDPLYVGRIGDVRHSPVVVLVEIGDPVLVGVGVGVGK